MRTSVRAAKAFYDVCHPTAELRHVPRWRAGAPGVL